MNQPLPIEELFLVSREEFEQALDAWLARKLHTAQVADRPDGQGQTLVFTAGEPVPLCAADLELYERGELIRARSQPPGQ